MSYRDRNDGAYDRNEGRFSDRDDHDDNERRTARDWDDWDRGQRDFGRGQQRYDLRQQPDLRQQNDLRSQGRGFRDEDYGHSRFYNGPTGSARDYGERAWNDRQPRAGNAYSGPTGTYSGYSDQRQGSGSNYRNEDWGQYRAVDGYYGSRARPQSDYQYGGSAENHRPEPSYGRNAWQSFGSERSFQAPRSYPSSYGQASGNAYGSSGGPTRRYEAEGTRGEYRGSHEDNWGQTLRDAGESFARSVKRVFRGPKGYVRSDERIREDVSDRLAQQDEVDPSEIEVKVSNGEVTLSGTVQSRHEKFVAEQITDDVVGVKDIHNQIRVRRQEDSQTSNASTTATSANGLPNTQSEPSRTRNGHA